MSKIDKILDNWFENLEYEEIMSDEDSIYTDNKLVSEIDIEKLRVALCTKSEVEG